MSEATLADESRVEAAPARGAALSIQNIVLAVLFSATAVLWTLYYVFEYTIYNSGHYFYVLEGLWMLYSLSAIGLGGWRVRPREGRLALHRASLGLVTAQGAFLFLALGSAWLGEPVKALSWSAVGLFLASPLIAAGVFFSSRRRWWLVGGQLAWQGVFWALYFLEPTLLPRSMDLA